MMNDMNTPICDFLDAYAAKNTLRAHMPGHKGHTEPFDITEIDGADSLYEASGIIMESERNASALFGANTFYSTEGSSLCIRAMLYLCAMHAKSQGKKPHIAALRNAHKAFLSAVALLDIEVTWLYPERSDSYLSCEIGSLELERYFAACKALPTALYLTSPDYLGKTLDIAKLSGVCHRYGILLIVDNAHGAYLKFLKESRHPIDLGADMCCDSAHKTLPALTGAAYLHIANGAPEIFTRQAKNALALFRSTSPSYLILRSLDALNLYLSTYAERLDAFTREVTQCKEALLAHGYTLYGDEPLKLTVAAKPYGYQGKEIAALLAKDDIIIEFADPDFAVMMLTPELENIGLRRLTDALLRIPKKEAITALPPRMCGAEYVMSPREAMLSPLECVPIGEGEGRVLAQATVGCPPAVPIVVSGERITEEALGVFAYYGIDTLCVIKE